MIISWFDLTSIAILENAGHATVREIVDGLAKVVPDYAEKTHDLNATFEFEDQDSMDLVLMELFMEVFPWEGKQ